ncbi:MAG TPA: DUF2285 domain-containing protein [Microvirga sp.]|jgi:hypothetical protein|nr:DUF2285 domain-containing protein [Microvirga sp.]
MLVPLPAKLSETSAARPSWPSAWGERIQGDERHVLLGPGGGTQLALVEGADLKEPTAFVIPADQDVPARVEALLAFWQRLTGHGLPYAGVTPQRRQRLVLGLRALDGRAAGASYRVLADGLFGRDRVPAGAAWKTHDLRSRTMRLVADATALMRGGYRALAGLPPLA